MVAHFSGLLAIATIAIASVAAQAPTSNLLNGACVTNYDASVDYFPQKLNTGKKKYSLKKKTLIPGVKNLLIYIY